MRKLILSFFLLFGLFGSSQARQQQAYTVVSSTNGLYQVYKGTYVWTDSLDAYPSSATYNQKVLIGPGGIYINGIPISSGGSSLLSSVNEWQRRQTFDEGGVFISTDLQHSYNIRVCPSFTYGMTGIHFMRDVSSMTGEAEQSAIESQGENVFPGQYDATK